MKRWILFGLLCVSGMAQAQLYRWVDDKGSVHYSDQPPPPNVKKVEQKHLGDNVVQSDKQPYATRQAMQNFPVTLYTGDCGEACAAGKAYLAKRGIPYTERLPGKNQADLDQLKKITGENLIPLLLVGNAVKLKGFNETEWASALDQAGYPQTGGSAPGAAPPSAPPQAPAPKPAAKTSQPK